MPKINSVNWPDTLQNNVLSPIDNIVATPFNNYEFIRDLEYDEACPGPSDAKHPYSDINDSANALLLKGSVFFLTVLGLIFSIFIILYKNMRKREGISHYFIFENLFKILGKNKFKDMLGHCSIPYACMSAVAYFYNPDIPAIVLWFRRTWAFSMRQTAFLNLEKYLSNERKKRNKTKDELLEEINKKINKKLALFISKQKIYGEWGTEIKDGKWIIKPSDNYFAAWQIKNGFKKGYSHANAANLNEDGKLSRFLDFIKARLDELGKASFVYWIGVFVFCFFPGVGVYVVSATIGVVWPPILIAVIFLSCLWITNFYKWRINKRDNLICDEEKSVLKKDIKFFIEAVKHRILLDALLKQEKTVGSLRYVKVKFRERCENSQKYIESKLCREIKEVLKTKSDIRIVRAIFNGFVIGCFVIFFSSWLLMAAIGLATPLNFTVIALVTLGLGLVYGIYSAIKYYQQEMKALLFLEQNFAKLLKSYGDIEIPDISLRECDRLFRRGAANSTVGTLTKQFCKRLWTGFIRFGTGMLFLKLLPLGTAMTVLGLSIVSSSVFFPMLGVMLAGGLFFASCHICLYHYESKGEQAGRIMDFFLKGTYKNTVPSLSITTENINNNHEPVSMPQESPPTTPLDANETAFHLFNSGNNRFPLQPDQCQTAFLNKKILRRSSSSENLLKENQYFGRKRSNTSPPNIGNDKEPVDGRTIEGLKRFNILNKRKAAHVNCSPNPKTNGSMISVPSVNLISSH